MPHPLARELAGCLEAGARVLLLGVGTGRNVPPLLAAEARVDVVEDDPERARAAVERFAGDGRVRVARTRYAGPIPFAGGFAAALSTHALQHGSLGGITAAVAAVRSRLVPGARFFLTLGSKRDPRFASGRRIDADVAAPRDGTEAGVAHVYLDEPQVQTLLAGFEIESAVEGSAAETAGRWAHPGAEADGLVHWFVRARRS